MINIYFRKKSKCICSNNGTLTRWHHHVNNNLNNPNDTVIILIHHIMIYIYHTHIILIHQYNT